MGEGLFIRRGSTVTPSSDLVLYFEGDENISESGGWSKTYTEGGSDEFTKYADHFFISTDSDLTSSLVVSHATAIDLTPYSNLKVEMSISDHWTEGFAVKAVNNVFDLSAPSVLGTAQIDTRETYNLDISAITGDKYVLLESEGSNTQGSTNMKIYSVTLEV